MIYDEYYMDPEQYLKLIKNKDIFRNQIKEPDDATLFAWALEDSRDRIMYNYFKKAQQYRAMKKAKEYNASEEPFEVNISSSIKVK